MCRFKLNFEELHRAGSSIFCPETLQGDQSRHLLKASSNEDF